MALTESVQNKASRSIQPILHINSSRVWWIVIISLTFIIGLRDEVGVDWYNYVIHYERALYLEDNLIWWLNDPGYRLLEWISLRLDLGIYGVNYMGACILSIGLGIFCRQLSRPWLGLAISVPYLIIVVAMGYNRQAAALGILMLGFVALSRGYIIKFLAWVFIAAAFHRSALLVIPMALFSSNHIIISTIFSSAAIFLFAYIALLTDSLDRYEELYIDGRLESDGTLIRLFMTAIPAAIFLMKLRYFKFTESQKKLWIRLSVINFGLILLYFFSPSSTLIDRVALYMLPLQIVVFASLPEVLGKKKSNNKLWILGILCYYALIEFIWLNYAKNAIAWIPYQFYPWKLLWD